MTDIWLRLVERLVRTWTRLYTTGVSPDLRDRRRAEIDSDLWESRHQPQGPYTAAHLLWRLLLGVGDDVAWRSSCRPRSTVTRTAVAGLIAAMILVSGLRSWTSRMMSTPDSPGRSADTEKVTINLGAIDLGHIDLLVEESFYSNRTDFIRTAIRNQLATHAEALKQTVARRTLVLGLQQFSKRDLESIKASGTKLRIQVLGLVRIHDDVTPSLALQTIESISVLGALHASAAVKAALTGRIN